MDDTEQIENIAYTVENVTEFGGDVVFVVAPLDTLIVLIERRTPIAQQVNLEPFTEFPANTIEFAYDKLTRIAQEQDGKIQDGDGSQPNLVLSVFARVGHIIANALDYIAKQIGYDNALSNLTATDVQDAIDELDGVLDSHIADDNIDDGGVRHHNQTHLLYGPDHTDVDTSVALEDGSTLVFASAQGKWFGLNVMVAAGYGGVGLGTPVGIPDLGAGFEVLPADAGLLTTPRFITQDFANDGLRFNIEGVFSVSVVFSLLHNESNAGRSIAVQMFNDTAAAAVFSIVLPIARNQPGTYFSMSFLAEVSAANIGDLFQIRIGGLDTVTTVIVQAYAFNANHVSEWKAQ